MRLSFPQRAPHLLETGLEEFLLVEGCFAGQQFVKQHAEAVKVAAGVNVQRAHFRLLRAHVSRRADELFVGREHRVVGQPLAIRRFGDSEINHLRHGHAVEHRYQDVRRLDIAVDDALLMRMLNGIADLDEQIQPLAGIEAVFVAVSRNPHPAHEFHHKVRAARFRSAGIENPGDAQLDDFERDPAADRRLLLGHVNNATPAFPDSLKQLVRPDPLSELLVGERD